MALAAAGRAATVRNIFAMLPVPTAAASFAARFLEALVSVRWSVVNSGYLWSKVVVKVVMITCSACGMVPALLGWEL